MEALESVLFVLAPSVFAVVTVSMILLAAIVASNRSEDSWATDCHFVFFMAFGGVVGSLALAAFIRAISGLHYVDLFGTGIRSSAYIGLWAIVWGIGAIVVFARLIVGTVAAAFVVQSGVTVASSGSSVLRDVVDDVQIDLRRSVPVPVVLSRRCSSPFVVGAFNPVVVLPMQANSWDEKTARSVLLHEVAHVVRRDGLAVLLMQLAGTFLWWNPLYWIASRRSAVFREMACDELVLSRWVDSAWYADLLLRFSGRQRSIASLGFATIPMAAKSTLSQRIKRLLFKKVPNRASILSATQSDVVMVTILAALVFGFVDVAGRSMATEVRAELAELAGYTYDSTFDED